MSYSTLLAEAAIYFLLLKSAAVNSSHLVGATCKVSFRLVSLLFEQ